MIAQAIKMAIKSILSNKMRSFLTMLGIIIGVVSLVVLVSLVTSATNSVTAEIESLGKDMLNVSIMDDKGNPLKLSEVKEMSSDESISMVAPSTVFPAKLKGGKESIDVTAEGTNGAYFQIMGRSTLNGRSIKESDMANGNFVIVLSHEAAEEVYNTTDVVGQYISLNGYKFLIVGVLTKDESMMASFSTTYSVFIPYTVAERIAASPSGVSTFYASASEPDKIDEAEVVIKNNLLKRFKNDEDAFYVFNQNTLSQAMNNITSIFSLLLGGIAAISLLVGGIGIMNIMLVSVTERTREIGIRKAIGSNNVRIMLQFLIEALAICLLGCLLGIGLSFLILTTVNIFVTEVTFSISFGIIIVSVLFSTTIGLVFGLYPARKASKMNPIDALRFE